MAKLIRCECGFVARGTDDDQVVDAIRAHMRTDHPVLAGMDRSEIFGWIEEEQDLLAQRPRGRMTTTMFDAAGYKRTTREQWQTAAGAWRRWEPVIDDWLEEATELMLDLASVGPGGRVLDVAAGAGGQSFAAARRVGPDGEVLATDIAENLVRYLEQDAAAAGLTQVRTAGRRDL